MAALLAGVDVEVTASSDGVGSVTAGSGGDGCPDMTFIRSHADLRGLADMADVLMFFTDYNSVRNKTTKHVKLIKMYR